jgi:predicted nucleotidyltransferase
MKRLQTLLFVLVNLSEQLLELLGQAIDFALCTAQALSVEVLQRDIAEKDPQENA